MYKDPVTDPGKASKKGRFSVINNGGAVYTVRHGHSDEVNMLKVAYEGGRGGYTWRAETFADIRKRAKV